MKDISGVAIRFLYEEAVFNLPLVVETAESYPGYVVKSFLFKERNLTTELAKEKIDIHRAIGIMNFHNCCGFFEGMCRQYAVYKNAVDSDDIEEEKREFYENREYYSDFDDFEEYFQYVRHKASRGEEFSISFCGTKYTRYTCLFDLARDIDEIIEENYKTLKEKGTKYVDEGISLSDEDLYRYCVLSAFESLYFYLRDHIDGKSYTDGIYRKVNRVLGPDAKEASRMAIGGTFTGDDTVTESIIEQRRKELLAMLENGKQYLYKIDFTRGLFPTQNVNKNEKLIEQLIEERDKLLQNNNSLDKPKSK